MFSLSNSVIDQYLSENLKLASSAVRSLEQTKTAFVALIGAPNAGKSTLLNQLVGSKISIVCRKAQTTRTRVRGVVNEGDTQLIFVDTPGLFRPKRRLDRSMVGAAWSGLKEADRAVLVIDAARGLRTDVRDILDKMKKSAIRADIALNKTDLVKRKDELLKLIEEIHAYDVSDEIFMISAQTGDGVEALKNVLLTKAPLSPWLYNGGEVTDSPMKFLASEITREKILHLIHEELPYNMTVETDKIEKTKSGTKTPVKITQTVFVTRDGHKRILIGKGGEKLKQIGADARIEMAELFARPVHLFIFVKVRENWQDDPERYIKQGLEFA